MVNYLYSIINDNTNIEQTMDQCYKQRKIRDIKQKSQTQQNCTRSLLLFAVYIFVQGLLSVSSIFVCARTESLLSGVYKI